MEQQSNNTGNNKIFNNLFLIILMKKIINFDGVDKSCTILIISELMIKVSPSTEMMVEKGAINKSLTPMYNLNKAEQLWDAGVELKDLEGKTVKKEDGVENPIVWLPTPETCGRIQKEERLAHVIVHDFKSKYECAVAIGATSLISKVMNKQELMQTAAIISDNKVYNDIAAFSGKYGMPASTAQKYFGVKIEASDTNKLILGDEIKELTPKRTAEEAEKLFEMLCEKLGDKAAKNRYAMEAINYLTKPEAMTTTDDEIKTALSQVTYEERKAFDQESSSDKKSYLSILLLKKIEAIRKVQLLPVGQQEGVIPEGVAA